MLKNELYDVIIVGASDEGLALHKELLASGKKTLLVSRDLDDQRDNCLKGEMAYSAYLSGLLGVTLKSRETLWAKAVVLATGSKPKQRKCPIKSENVYFNTKSAGKWGKSSPAVVVGDGELAAKYALAVSKRFKYVYLCSGGVELGCSKKTAQKLNETANIVHLPNCCVVGGKVDKNGRLQELTLDTYATIKCNALFIAAERVPEVPTIDKRMIELNEVGAIKTKAHNETTIVPNLYAIGACSDHNTKNSVKAVRNAIIGKEADNA